MDNALDIAVLVTTMYQKDFELIKEMNIQCQSIVANQDDKQSFDWASLPRMESSRLQGIQSPSGGVLEVL